MATSKLSAPPLSWPDPQAMSTLDALLFFGGITLTLVVVISLLAAAPTLARGPRYRPGRGWWAEPLWFGGPGEQPAPAPALPAAPADQDRQPVQVPDRMSEGGASARW